MIGAGKGIRTPARFHVAVLETAALPLGYPGIMTGNASKIKQDLAVFELFVAAKGAKYLRNLSCRHVFCLHAVAIVNGCCARCLLIRQSSTWARPQYACRFCTPLHAWSARISVHLACIIISSAKMRLRSHTALATAFHFLVDCHHQKVGRVFAPVSFAAGAKSSYCAYKSGICRAWQHRRSYNIRGALPSAPQTGDDRHRHDILHQSLRIRIQFAEFQEPAVCPKTHNCMFFRIRHQPLRSSITKTSF